MMHIIKIKRLKIKNFSVVLSRFDRFFISEFDSDSMQLFFDMY